MSGRGLTQIITNTSRRGSYLIHHSSSPFVYLNSEQSGIYVESRLLFERSTQYIRQYNLQSCHASVIVRSVIVSSLPEQISLSTEEAPNIHLWPPCQEKQKKTPSCKITAPDAVQRISIHKRSARKDPADEKRTEQRKERKRYMKTPFR